MVTSNSDQNDGQNTIYLDLSVSISHVYFGEVHHIRVLPWQSCLFCLCLFLCLFCAWAWSKVILTSNISWILGWF